MNRAHKKTYDEFKKQKEQFKIDTTLIATETMDKIGMSAITIKEEIETAVEHHLTSEPMKDIISANALELFTTICDSKIPEIVDRMETTTKAILKDDIWLKNHVESITAQPPQLNNRIFLKLYLRPFTPPPPNKSSMAILKRPVFNMRQRQRTTLRKSSVRKVKLRKKGEAELGKLSTSTNLRRQHKWQQRQRQRKRKRN